MKLIVLLLAINLMQITASVYSQNTSFKVENAKLTLQEAIKAIESQTDYRVAYSATFVDQQTYVEFKQKETSVVSFLESLTKEIGIGYLLLENDVIVLTSKESKFSNQEITVKGTVTDLNSTPLPGVNIVEKGTSNGTVTDINGNYSISVSSAETVLSFSYIGFLTEEMDVNGQSTINISLVEDIQSLEEVVVVGYGTVKKTDLTGSIATVDEDDYKYQPISRVDQVLQGRTAGVNVMNSSGAPGGSVQVRIRGANSITGNNDPLYVVDGFVGADFKDVNPTDIESIQVLKDAASTAIYGSRGSNGIILITTKSGKSGKPKVSFTARYLTSEVLKTWDLMDAATFAETVNERKLTLDPESTPTFTPAEIDEFRLNGGTNWQDEIFRSGNGQEYQLDYSGGNDNVNYYISGNYYDQDGIVVNSWFKRYSLRTNIQAKLTEKLGANLKMNFARRENQNTSGNQTTSASPINQALAWAPTTPARDEAGIPIKNDPVSSVMTNPLELIEKDAISEESTFSMYGGFNYQFIEGLTLDISFGANYMNRQGKNFAPQRKADTPSATRTSAQRLFLQNTNNLTYSRVFNNVHRLTLTGVFENQVIHNESFSSTATELTYPDLKYNNLTLAESSSSYAGKTDQSIRSYIGRVNYSLMDKYLVTASLRHDGSSKFRGDNSYSTFPSVGIGWRLSEESFMENLELIHNLKLRASWGQTGNQAIAPLGTVTVYNTSATASGASFEKGIVVSGVSIGNPGNPELRWETTTQSNIGLDVSILNGRLGLEADYFEKYTKDLLLQEPVPEYAGGGNIMKNIGEVKNTGFEFSLNAYIIESKDFKWSSSFNTSFLTNEIIDIGDRDYILTNSGGAAAGLTSVEEFIVYPGGTVSTFYGYNYLGVWKTSEAEEASKFGYMPGDSKYEDVNGDYIIDGSDLMPIGDAIPDMMFGWNNTLAYKNFVFNAFFQAMTGFEKMNYSYATAMVPAADAREVTHSDILDRWIAGSNEDSEIPAFSGTDEQLIQSSRFLEEGDYLRLKNVSLTYHLPENLIKNISGSVTISGLNLWTLTNYKGLDPEAFSHIGSTDARGADAGAYPNSKTWTIGLNINF